MLKSLLLALVFGTAFNAFAAGPSITGVAGASNYTLPTTTGTTTSGSTIIYGGMAGLDCNGDGGTTTCNSCTIDHMTTDGCADAANATCACNSTRIHSNSSLSITVNRVDTATGNIRIAVANGNTYNTVGTGTGDAVTATWSDVCQASTLGTTCEAGVSGNLTINAKIFIDKDNNNVFDTINEASVATDFSFRLLRPDTLNHSVFGFSEESGFGSTSGPGFVPYPGDEKVYIEDLESPTTTFGYGGKAVKLRVFHSDTAILSANAVSENTTDLTVSTDGNTLDRNVVSNGLTNNTTYVFRVASVDEANNIVQFFPDGSDGNCANPPFTGCPWAATPEEVLGLLTDDINCFIATAAYGSFLEPKLKTFRDFKFKILLQNKYGRQFVNAYYKYGPYAARWIHDKPWLRTLTQAALWPLYAYSAFALQFGFLPATALAFLLLTLISAALFFTVRRGFARSA